MHASVGRSARRRQRRSVAAVLAATLLLADCGSGPETTDAAPGGDRAGPSAESSPFTVGPAPEGYRLVTAGRGTDEQL
ncbi:MAG: hypothetical protein ACR2JF_12150 [Iamia sp.]